MGSQHLNQTQKSLASSQSQTKAIVQPLQGGIAQHSPHPIEELQGLIGNRAVNQLLESKPPVPAKPMFRGLSQELVVQPQLIQRQGVQKPEKQITIDDDRKIVEDRESLSNRDENVIKKLAEEKVNRLLELEERKQDKFEKKDKIEILKETGQELGKKVEPLAKDNPPVATSIIEALHEEAETKVAEFKPHDEKPQKLENSSVVQLQPNDEKNQEAAKSLDNSSRKNARKRYANIGAAGLSKGVIPLVKQLAPVASLVNEVASAAGFFLSFISLALSTKSAVSSWEKANELEDIFKQASKVAKKQGVQKDVVDAVQYAMTQKYSKFYKKITDASAGFLGVIGTTATLLGAIGLSAAMLASNPVGWGIAVLIAGGTALVGATILIQKIAHYVQKKREGRLGKKRQEIAFLLYEQLLNGNEIASKAIETLGLNPQELKDAEKVAEPDAIKQEKKEDLQSLQADLERREAKVASAEQEKKSADEKLSIHKSTASQLLHEMAKMSGAALPDKPIDDFRGYYYARELDSPHSSESREKYRDLRKQFEKELELIEHYQDKSTDRMDYIKQKTAKVKATQRQLELESLPKGKKQAIEQIMRKLKSV